MDEHTQDTENVQATETATETSREDAAERAQERLDALFADEADEETTETTDAAEAESEAEESGSDDSTDDQGDGEAEEAADTDEATPASGAPTLPDAHRRSLKAYGWQDAEIDQNLAALGDGFLRTAERLHENRNTELQQWAAAGRATRSQEAATEQPATQQQTTGGQQPQSEGGQTLKPIDADSLKRQYGDDEMVDAIVGPVNDAINALNNMVPQVQQAQIVAKQSEIEEMGRQVDTFFGGDSLKGYGDLYGSGSDGLSEDQYAKRVEVLDKAYDLRVGAAQVHNREMGLHEALELAHEIVAKDFHSKATRQSLTREAKQRNKGILQRPSNRNSADSGDGPKTRPQLEKATARRLKEVFG